MYYIYLLLYPYYKGKVWELKNSIIRIISCACNMIIVYFAFVSSLCFGEMNACECALNRIDPVKYQI